MPRFPNPAVELVEAAYDLERKPREWLQHLLANAQPLLDFGHGCAAIVLTQEESCPSKRPMCAHRGEEAWVGCLASIAKQVDAIALGAKADRRRHGVRTRLADAEGELVHQTIADHFGCEDVVEIWALDEESRGIVFYAPCASPVDLSRQDVAKWRALASHVAAGYRVRRGLGLAEPEVTDEVEVTERVRRIREVAVHGQRSARVSNVPSLAAIAKEGLLDGQWSMLDWFDHGGRRYVLVRPNAPRSRDPRALSPREHQVATYAALGESGKIVGYRLGLSPTLVSTSLRSAMRKLGVKTQAQLVIQMRCLGGTAAPSAV
ncbi:MAG: helix-turn-helix transcriptional regulator [Myxococcota bacterium]